MDKIESIRNPHTGRIIRVGGKLYNSLIREGVIKGIIEEKNNTIYDINENDDVDFIKNELSKNLPFHETAVKGKKGTKYENKIVKRKKIPNASEVASETIKRTASKIKNKEIDCEDDDFAKNLEKMILEEILGNEKAKKSKIIPIKREKATPKKREFVMRKLPEPQTETEIEFEETELESDEEIESEGEESD
jgi:hypothetical protein